MCYPFLFYSVNQWSLGFSPSTAYYMNKSKIALNVYNTVSAMTISHATYHMARQVIKKINVHLILSISTTGFMYILKIKLMHICPD